jgi:NADPH-dependent ferric siderophore reductase
VESGPATAVRQSEDRPVDDTGRAPLWSYLPAQVIRAEQLSPNLRRIEVGGAGLRALASSGRPDQRVVVALPLPGQDDTPPPRWTGTLWDYSRSHQPPPLRNYTIRAWQPDEPRLTIDFVVHGHGVASTWAEQARPGSLVYVAAGNSWYAPPPECDWQVLVADLTGLPALARILAGRPSGETPSLETHVVIEVPDAQDAADLDLDGVASCEVIVAGGPVPSERRLLAAVQRMRPPGGRGYVWAAAEAGTTRAARSHVRTAWGVPRAHGHLVGYWRHDHEDWLTRYAKVKDQIIALRERAHAAGRSHAEAEELVVAALERAGL